MKFSEFMLLTSFIYIIYIILSYLELIRYVKCKCKNPQTYLKSYLKLGKNKNKTDVYIICDKTSQIKPTINSILDQTEAVDSITILCEKNDTTDLTEFGKIYEINKCENMLKYISEIQQNKSRVIILSGYIIYGKDFIENLQQNIDKNPQDIITYDKNILNGCIYYDTPENKNIKYIKFFENYHT